MTDPRRVLTYTAALYVIALPVCSGIVFLPIGLAAVLFGAYPIWLAVWLVALYVALRGLGKLYGKTKMEMWWWFSVPYSVAIPALSLILGFGSWATAHMLGPFMLVAFLTLPSSLLWAIVAVARAPWNRKVATEDKVMLSLVPAMVLLWVAVLKR
jgi:hypothetical protein